jgi:hypothetical protein
MRSRGSIAPPARPLPTRRCAVMVRQRMTQGHPGSLLLRCRVRSPSPRRFMPALSAIAKCRRHRKPNWVVARSTASRPRAHPTSPPRTAPPTLKSPAHMTTSSEASVGCFGPGSVGGTVDSAPGDFAADLLVFEACAPRGRTLRLHVLDGTVLVGQFELREPVLMQSPSCFALWARRAPYRRRRYGSSPADLQGIDACSSMPLTGGSATRVGP